MIWLSQPAKGRPSPFFSILIVLKDLSIAVRGHKWTKYMCACGCRCYGGRAIAIPSVSGLCSQHRPRSGLEEVEISRNSCGSLFHSSKGKYKPQSLAWFTKLLLKSPVAFSIPYWSRSIELLAVPSPLNVHASAASGLSLNADCSKILALNYQDWVRQPFFSQVRPSKGLRVAHNRHSWFIITKGILLSWSPATSLARAVGC